MLYYIGKLLVVPFLWLIFRPQIRNRARLKTKGAAIYICNHFSMADPVLLASVTPRVIYFMAKESLFGTWYQKLLFRSLLVTPASDNGNSLAAVKTALSMLKKGRAFGIFPEGHRCTDKQDMDEIERGTAFIALKSGAPVIPVYIDPNSLQRLRITGAVGEPIDPKLYASVTGPVKPVDVLTRTFAAVLEGLQAETNELLRKRGVRV